MELIVAGELDKQRIVVSRLERVVGQFELGSRVALGPFESIKDRSLVQWS